MLVTQSGTTVGGFTVSQTATAASAAATLNALSGVITSEALTTAAGATYGLVLTNSPVAATSRVFASVGYGSSTAGTPAVTMVTPSAGSVKITVQNVHASAAVNGTLKISFWVLP